MSDKKPNTKVKNPKVAPKATTKKREFKDISTPTGGKIDEVKKMGRPKAEKKPKNYSVYVYEDEVTSVCDVVGGETPNEFVKDVYKAVSNDPDIMIKIMEIVYGAKSREKKMARIIKEELLQEAEGK